ncbi:glycoside hydrolase family 13 protein [Acutalibacter caecimuris]|uniref:glycoside hydrolase family 13 protein n=1 Tax=Acutalibacter caecimuris TaxID=3093657 RepID=UPI002AC8FDDC|nr:glycoside hydrolase family 13 protein [Acutalibacter sp. M00118]
MFYSRNPKYRTPVGAVEAESTVHFRITLPRELGCSAARLIVEQEGAPARLQDMFWCGMNGDNKEWWECDFTPETPGLYFYLFEASTCRGVQRLSRGDRGAAIFGGTYRWQLTVYQKGLQTPAWLEGGVMYQVFPDRFCKAGGEKEGVPAGRSLHSDWYGQPDWRPNEQGEITNSDFFGGDLRGIEEKLPYLKSLGVTCLYLNPVFESHSNHRYDTADYEKIDPLLGGEADFRSLCAAAEAVGIRVMIDGVFSHTGSDSVYFNREGRYGSQGAYNSVDSPYYKWYNFRAWPQEYDSWWGFATLPNVNEVEESYNRFINGEDGIVRRWLRAGASGWRLDVADELPDPFIDRLAAAAKAEKPDALVLGEVWEDASNKSAYGVRRRYLLGGQLDSVMNYPFRDAILGFLLGGPAGGFAETVENIVENYPPQCLRLLMNHIGTHDTERALTVLGGEPAGHRGREWQSAQRMTAAQREKGISRLKLAAILQFMLPGVPCIYYGDEAGMEGYRDPFNRACYPWGREDADLLGWYRQLGAMRAANQRILARGGYRTLRAEGNLLAIERWKLTASDGEDRVYRDSLLLIVNRSERPQSIMSLKLNLAGGHLVMGEPLGEVNVLRPFGCSLMKFCKEIETSS